MANCSAQARECELRNLMTASLDGDEQAYHTLLRRLTGHLRAYFRRRFAVIGRGPAEAEELLQEVLIVIHTRRRTYDPLQPFTPWFHAIARHKLRDYLRRRNLRIKDIPAEGAQDLTAECDVTAVETGLDLEHLLSLVSHKTRRATRCPSSRD
jgi:RNA polymerase sigma-70 factor, ECF subfamily